MTEQCKECKQWSTFPESHKCPPAWFAVDMADDDWTFAIKVFAFDAEEAATVAAEKMDDGCDEVTKRTIGVKLCENASGIELFDITFDYKVEYYAHPVPTNGDAA